MTCFFAGSYDKNYYSEVFPDGYSFIRMSLVGCDLASFAILGSVILMEPIFLNSFRQFFKLKHQERYKLEEDEEEGKEHLLSPQELLERGIRDTDEYKYFRK